MRAAVLTEINQPLQILELAQDYQELKQELGLGDHEGRGFHHATLCIAAYGFLITE